MNKPNPLNFIPNGYEVVETVETSDDVCQYVATPPEGKSLVGLRVYDFSGTASTTRARHLRDCLRNEIGFMDELDHANIIKLYDYSETRRNFWIATLPANIEKLSDSFSKLSSLPFDLRVLLLKKLLTALEYMHNHKVIHRNLSGDAIFLGDNSDIYVGDFSYACYLSGASTTRYDTNSTSSTIYQAPEIKDIQTTSFDSRCDVFSAGLLAIEILTAEQIPKSFEKGLNKTIQDYLEQQPVLNALGFRVIKVLKKAIKSDPDKRWLSIKSFFKALDKAFEHKSAGTVDIDHTQTIPITKPTGEESEYIDHSETKTIRGTEGATEQVVTRVSIEPRDSENEIWNNRYEILDKIGGGGQAVVYKALDHLTNEEIAVKSLLSRHRKDQSAVNRLKQEAMVARSLTHNYIIKTYSVEQRTDIEQKTDAVFICMELIKSGLELKHVLDKRRSSGKHFSVDEVLHVIRQLLSALKYAHSFTIHRDVKPANIMLVPHEGHDAEDTSDLTKFDIRLMDFGIAKVLTKKRIEVTGKGFWSAHYGAPELANARDTVDARADIYSVGVIIYQMFTGHIPRKGSLSVNKINKNVSAQLSNVIDLSINADRDKRYKNAFTFIKEIDRAAGRFSWLPKALKIAAMFLCFAAAVLFIERIIPDTESIPIPDAIDELNLITPETQIPNSGGILYEGLEGFEDYNLKRLKAISDLESSKGLGNETIKSNSPSWKAYQESFAPIEELAIKLGDINRNRTVYLEYRDSDMVSEINSAISDEPIYKLVKAIIADAKNAEVLLSSRSLGEKNITTCDHAYRTAANALNYIIEKEQNADLKEGIVESLNNEIKDVERLKNEFKDSKSRIAGIEQLDKEKFDVLADRCLENAYSYEKNFDFYNAVRLLNILNRIAGVLANSRDYVTLRDVYDSDVILRLMELCYGDVESFYGGGFDQDLLRVEEKFKKLRLSEDAKLLRTEIIESPALKEDIKNFKGSELIGGYFEIAEKYKDVEIAGSIDNWVYVDDVPRLSKILSQMELLRDGLAQILARKKNMDELMYSDKGIEFGIEKCRGLRPLNDKEKQQYQEWLSGLQNAKNTLLDKENGTYFIDHQSFDSRYDELKKVVKVIIDALPDNRKRIEQVIERSASLDTTANAINSILGRWQSQDIIGNEISNVIHDSGSIIKSLEDIPDDVDNWDDNTFDKRMSPECKELTKLFDREYVIANDLTLAVIDKVTAIRDDMNEILSDVHLKELEKYTNIERNFRSNIEDLRAYCTDVLEVSENYSKGVSGDSFYDGNYDKFNVSAWFGGYSNAIAKLNDLMTILDGLNDISDAELEKLGRHHKIELAFYEEIQSATAKRLRTKHSEHDSSIKKIGNDTTLMEMRSFLEDMESAQITSLSSIGDSLTVIKDGIDQLGRPVNDLNGIASLDDSKKNILDKLKTVEDGIAEHNLVDLEKACKKTVTEMQVGFEQAIKRRDDSGKLAERAVSFWSFYSKHKNWDQWKRPLKNIFNIKVSNEDKIEFALLTQLQPADSSGGSLNIKTIIDRPEDVFNLTIQGMNNFGWPKYAISTKDPSLEFAFIPADPSASPEPFYMARREVSNDQYCLFLNKIGAKHKVTKLGINDISDFTGKNGKLLFVRQKRMSDRPAIAIQWDEAKKSFNVTGPKLGIDKLLIPFYSGKAPVAWVRFNGATAYAEWIVGSLPSVSQHRYACKAGTDKLTPWGSDRSSAHQYAHVRSEAWEKQATESKNYNNIGVPPLNPVGAETKGNIDDIFDNSKYDSLWPLETSSIPNTWELYDMIGNVWERCLPDENSNAKATICGGSCLSPTKYIYLNTEADYSVVSELSAANDIGFRVIIPAN